MVSLILSFSLISQKQKETKLYKETNPQQFSISLCECLPLTSQICRLLLLLLVRLLQLRILSSIKLQFFARIRRFLCIKSKGTRISSNPSDQFDVSKTKADANIEKAENCETETRVMEKQSSEEESVVVLKRCVKKLHFGNWEEKEMTAKEIEKLAKEDVKVRKLITELGVVPVLVSMVASEVDGRRRAGLKALIQLAHGTYT